MRYYDSREEVTRRLGGCVIFYQQDPVYVLEGCSVKGSKTKFGVVIKSLPVQDRTWKIPLDDPELNYRNLSVGFLNTDGGVYRVERQSLRITQQGLNNENCRLTSINSEARERDISFLSLVASKSVCDSLAGRYPSLDEARKEVAEGVASRAFHRHWAWHRNLGVPALWYKTRPVGLTIDPKVILKLEPELGYLKESLSEIGIRVGA